MSFLRNVLHDLVEKRLWPVAVALLVALVAAPVVLGRSSGSGDAAPAGDLAAATPSAPPSAAPADAKVVTLVQGGDGAPVHRGGKLLNPFKQHHQPKPDTPSTGGAPAPPPGPAPQDLARQTVQTAVDTAQQLVESLGGGAPPVGGTTPAVPAPAPDTSADDLSTYRVSLKFGEDGAMKTFTDIPRLTPLPSADNPFFIFLGVSPDRRSAVFLVSSDAVPTGDGTCKPSVDDCSEIEMQKHDLEYFDLQSGTAGVVQYQLEITGIHQGKAKTSAQAAKVRARESRAGRDYLRQVMAQEPERLGGWRFSKKTGLLVEPRDTTEDVAHVPAAIARAAVGQQPQSTATVMTVPAGEDPQGTATVMTVPVAPAGQ